MITEITMLFDRYLFRNLMIATVFIAVVLASIILLTQSMRFIELVIKSGASGTAFWILTLLALPRFFEVILPISLMAACLFIYNKFALDRELVVMRNSGLSPTKLARPALVLSVILTIVLWFMTMWLGPVSLAKMQNMRQVIKAQYSSLLFQDGVFNAAFDGLTIYIREKSRNNELHGIMIHDSREELNRPVTILASKGIIVTDNDTQKVIVYDGIRQDFNDKTGVLNKLNFDRYTIELPDDNKTVRQRWREPDERTFLELLTPDTLDRRDVKKQRDFMIEAHRRIASPLLAPTFVIVTLCFLLIGPVNRKGQFIRISGAIASVVLIQSLFLICFNIASKTNLGLFFMYGSVLLPLLIGLFSMNPMSEPVRQKIFSVISKKFGKAVKS